MPVPGPRNQFRPEPGYRNPELQVPSFINLWKRPGPVWWPGRSPGTMFRDLRGMVLAPGQIRFFYRQSTNYIAAQPPYSWTQNGPQPGRPQTASVRGFRVTRSLRFKETNSYIGSGDNSRYGNLHTIVRKVNRHKPITVGAGQRRYAPTVRNRISSFGSRVPTENQRVEASDI